MSIYESGPKPRTRTKIPPRKADPSKILNDKDLSELVKKIKGGPKTAKELLFDTEKNVVGVLQRDGTPFFLSQSQVKELKELRG